MLKISLAIRPCTRRQAARASFPDRDEGPEAEPVEVRDSDVNRARDHSDDPGLAHARAVVPIHVQLPVLLHAEEVEQVHEPVQVRHRGLALVREQDQRRVRVCASDRQRAQAQVHGDQQERRQDAEHESDRHQGRQLHRVHELIHEHRRDRAQGQRREVDRRRDLVQHRAAGQDPAAERQREHDAAPVPGLVGAPVHPDALVRARAQHRVRLRARVWEHVRVDEPGRAQG